LDCPQCYSSLEDFAAGCPFCGWAPAPETSAPAEAIADAPEPEAPAEWLARWRAQFEERRILLPPALVEQARRMLSQAERQMRLATVVFPDLVGYSAESRLHHPAAIEATLAEFGRVATETALLHGGFVAGFAGDAVMLVFGAPVGFDRDAENAVAAVVELRERLRDLAWPDGRKVQLRAGVATGRMLATVRASGAEGAFTVIGHTVNLAARLQQNAPPGEILICPDTGRSVHRRFRLESVAPLKLKNVADACVAWRVIDERDRPDPAADPIPPFVGRRTELDRLTRAFDAVAGAAAGRNHPLHVVLDGEPGIGKSRLARELAERLTPLYRPVFFEASQIGRHILLQPVIHWLRSLVELPARAEPASVERAIADFFDEHASLDRADGLLMGYLFGLPPALAALRATPPERLRDSLFRFFLQCLRARADGKSLLLIFDDAQWLDETTLQWRRWLMNREPEGLAILTTLQVEGEGATSCADEPIDLSLLLGPLKKTEREQLARSLLGDEPAAAGVRELIERSGGNPLYMTELARWRRRGGADAGAAAADDLPETIVALVQRRLDQLNGHARLVLQCGAVLGRSFARRMLEEIRLANESLTADVELLKAHAYFDELTLERDLWLRFLHPIVREATYDALLPEQRSVLHAHVARRIEEDARGAVGSEACDLLAYHWEHAGEETKALYWLIKGSEQAHQLGAYDATLERCRRALQILRGETGNAPAAGVQRLRLHLRMGRIQTTLGRLDQAQESLEQAASVAVALDNTPGAIEAAVWTGVLAIHRGRTDPARAQLDRALGQARGAGLDHLVAPCLSALGVLEYQQANAAAAAGHFERLAELGESRRRADWLADAFNNGALVHWKAGHYGEAADLFARALPHRRATRDLAGLAVTLMNIGVLMEQLGRDEAAMDHYRQARELAARIGHAQCLAAAAVNESNLLRRAGDPKAALDRAAEAVAAAARIGDVRLESYACNNFAQAGLLLGMKKESLRHVRRAIALLRGSNVDREALLSARLTRLELRLAARASAKGKRTAGARAIGRSMQMLEAILHEIRTARDAMAELEPRALMLKALLSESIEQVAQLEPGDAAEIARRARRCAKDLNNPHLQRLVEDRLAHLLVGAS
jgi:class 3 adenylate cyclase/tetratricopeptide (TPR) repeat protein